MADFKLQESGYLRASFGLMTADTRQGLTPDAQRDLAVLKAHSAAPHVVAYVEKVERASAVTGLKR